MSSIDIPITAKPHEVAILEKYLQVHSTYIIARRLHYKDERPVQIVLAKYKDWLASHGVIYGSPVR